MLAWLRCFEAAARHMSFTRAASELCVTQGAVSQQVRQLEDQLQHRLFIRKPRTLELTPEGSMLASTVGKSFQSIELDLARLCELTEAGPLALSCSPSFAMSWLTPRLGDFYRSHPDLGLRVIGEFHTLDRERMRRDGTAAAVRYDLGQYTDIHATEILDEWLLPVVSPEFMRANPSLRFPEGLHPTMLLHDANAWQGADPYEEWRHWLRESGQEPLDLQLGHHFNLAHLAQAAALAGQGIAMGRAAVVLEDVVAGRLVMPFGAPVRSKAAYHFLSLPESTQAVGTVRSWSQDQARLFRARRDKLLQLKC